MKKFILIGFASLLIFAHPVFSAEIPADSVITKITVYQDRALVTRSAKINVDKGRHAIVFQNLPSALIEESLRADGKSTVPVTIFGAELKKTFVPEEVNPRIAKLSAEMETLQDDLRVLQNKKDSLAEQKNFLDAVKNFSSVQIPKEIVTKSSTPVEWAGLSQYFLDSYSKNIADSFEVDKAMRQKNREIEAKQKELQEVNRPRDIEKKTAVVNIETMEAGSLEVELDYLVPQATWTMTYDAKVYPAKKLCTLISYGNVRQWTGEDWKNVSVTLSSAKPAIGGRIPSLVPWYVDFYQVIAYPTGLAVNDRLDVLRRKVQNNLYQNQNATGRVEESLRDLEKTSAPLETRTFGIAEAAVSQELGSVSFDIPQAMSILSDNQLYRSTVQSENFKAELDYAATPKLTPYAFIHSRIANDKDFTLVGGELNTFVNDNFIAKSSIATTGRGEKFDLYLGVDEDIKVKRTELVDKRNKAMLGMRARNDFWYKIKLENYKKEKAKITVFDQLPISKNSDIKAELDSKSLKPTKIKDLGTLTWEFELDPGQKKEFEFGFSVEYPADKAVSGI